MRYLIFYVVGALLVFGCSSKVTTATTSGKYSEDLSTWRPDAADIADSVQSPAETPQQTRTDRYVEARYADNKEVDTILDSIYAENRSRGFIDGYTIQVYSGIKREDALNVKKKLNQTLPELESEIEYRQPNFRVRMGQYYTRLEAQKDYLAVKRFFPNAIVIPDRISLH